MHICFGELAQEVERAKPGMKALYLRLYSFRCWNYSTCVELWFLWEFSRKSHSMKVTRFGESFICVCVFVVKGISEGVA